MAAFPTWVIACTPGASDRGCAAKAITVAAAPTIAPAVEDAARRYNAPVRCGRVSVVREEPREVAAALSGIAAKPSVTRPDAWLPDSSLWLAMARRTRAGAAVVRPEGRSIASSPLVLAAPRGRAPDRVSWRMLLSSRLPGTAPADGRRAMRVRFLDPAAHASGLGTLLLAHRASGRGRPGLATFAITLYTDLASSVRDDRAAYAAMFADGDPPTAVVLPEQSAWRHNRSTSGRVVTARYPAGGTLSLDFPYAATTTDPERSRAVADFGAALGAPQTREALQALGLRTPDGLSGPTLGGRYGIPAQAPGRIPLDNPATACAVLQMWERTVLGARMLVLLDVSPSMNDQVPRTRNSRMAATAKVATEGLRILSGNSQVGLWHFASRLDGPRDYRPVVPYRALTARTGGLTQRGRLVRAFAEARPVPGTQTALYDSILAGYREAQRTYRPDRNNVLVVLTDGRNHDPGHTISLSELLTKVRRTADPLRPVAIVPIAFGPDAEPGPLRQIAEATGGDAFVTLDPGQIQQVFLAMLIRLTCGRNCPVR